METQTYKRATGKHKDFPWKQQIDLRGTTIIAFGGAGNLSETFLYAASARGARMIIADLPLADRLGGIAQHAADVNPQIDAEVDVVHTDVTNRTEVAETLDFVLDKRGEVDVVIDFAGVHHPPFDFVQDDSEAMLEHFKRVVNINLIGAFIVTMEAARRMVPRRKGHIIHLCSNASRSSLYGSYGYNATKHGVEGLVKTAAAQLSPYGVRVNGIAPGTVETNLNRELLRLPNGNYKPRAMSILAHTPSKRFATREGIAESLLAMCVEQRHFTGNVVFADDGYNVEGHSWPEGNEALYAGAEKLEELLKKLGT